jgi:hypothetical protein
MFRNLSIATESCARDAKLFARRLRVRWLPVLQDKLMSSAIHNAHGQSDALNIKTSQTSVGILRSLTQILFMGPDLPAKRQAFAFKRSQVLYHTRIPFVPYAFN